MDLVVKMCGVVLLVLVPMAFGLVFSMGFGCLLARVREQGHAK